MVLSSVHSFGSGIRPAHTPRAAQYASVVETPESDLVFRMFVAIRPRPKQPVPSGPVRLIVARCRIRYTGRLNAVLPETTRLLMLKADGSVLVHADAGGTSL